MANKRKKNINETQPMLFGAWNYKMLSLGLFLVIAGFVAMYMENKVEGFISLFISPIVIMAGFITVIFAIMKHNGSGDTARKQDSN